MTAPLVQQEIELGTCAATQQSSSVLIDCYAPGCGPCSALAPILDDIALGLGEQLLIKKVDVTEHPEVAAKYGVRAVPTLLLFRGGGLVSSRTGAATRSQLLTWLAVNGAV